MPWSWRRRWAVERLGIEQRGTRGWALQPRVVYPEYGGEGGAWKPPRVPFPPLVFAPDSPCWTQTEEPGAAAGGSGPGTRGSRCPGRPPSVQAASLPGPGREREQGCEQLRESESREPEPEPARVPTQAPQPSPACAPARPPAQPARARGIVRWNTAPSSPRRGGKTPWCSPSKVGATTSQNFASPPGGEGAGTAPYPNPGP